MHIEVKRNDLFACTYFICITGGQGGVIESNAEQDLALNRRKEMQARKSKLNFRSSFLREKSVGLSNIARGVIEAIWLEMFKLDWAALQGIGSRSSLARAGMCALVRHLGKSAGSFV